MKTPFLAPILIATTAIVILVSLFGINNTLFNYAVIALSLGLRHGLDADHIIAIDNISAKLIREKKPSSNTGLFFALGHSSVVFLICLSLVLGLSKDLLTKITHLSIIGNLVSIGFLILSLSINLIALKNLKSGNQAKPNGFIARFFNKYFIHLIDKASKMYLVGFLFGLGFDTATEIGLLALTTTLSVKASFGVLVLPIIFACGMSFTDTLNSNLMSLIYNQDNTKVRLKYNFLILSFASIATFIVAVTEILNNPLVNASNHLFDTLNDNFSALGFSILAVFVIFGIYRIINKLKAVKIN